MHRPRLTIVLLLSAWIAGAATTAYAAGAESARADHESKPIGMPTGSAGAGGDVQEKTSGGLPLLAAGNEFLRVGVALGVVVGLMLLARGAARRLGGPLAGGGRPSGVLEVLGRYPIARSQHLVLLRLVGRIVLLHQGRGGVTTLSEITEPDEVAAILARLKSADKPAPAGRFQGFLSRAAGTGLRERTSGDDAVVVDLTRRRRPRAPREVSA